MKIQASLIVARHCTAFTLAIAALLASQSAPAASTTWTGNAGAGNTDLATATNWFANTLPPTGNTWALNATGTAGATLTNTLTSAAFSVQGITFGSSSSAAPSYTMSGNTFTLTGDINNNTAAVTQTLNMDIIMGTSNHNFTNLVSSGSLVFKGLISGPYNAVFNGLGTTTLNGADSNTYGAASGNVTAVTGGSTLILDFANMAAPADLLKNGSTLQLGTGTTGGGSTLNLKAKTGAGVTTTQTFGAVAVNNYANNIVLNPNGGDGVTLTLGAIARGTGNSTLNIDLSLPNTAVNSTTAAGTLGYATLKDGTATGFARASGTTLTRLTGQTTLPVGTTTSSIDYVTAGTLTKTAGAFSVNTLTLDGTGGVGALDLAGSTMTVTQKGVLTIGANAYTVSNGQVGLINNELSIHTMGTGGLTVSALIGIGNNSFIKNGPDMLTLSATNTYTGQTIINGGTLKAGSTQAFGVGSAVTFSNNSSAVLDLAGFNNSVASLNGSGPAGITLGTATLTITNGGSMTYVGTIAGTGGSVVKTGAGTQSLGGVNSYTGGTTIKSGVLNGNGNIATGTSPFGTGTVFLGDTTGSASATLGQVNGGGILTNAINVVAGNTGTLAIAPASGFQSYSGLVTLNNNLSVGYQAGSGSITFTGGFAGTGNLTLNSVANASSNSMTISTSAINMGGTLTNNNANANGATLSAAIGANVTKLTQNGTTLTLSGANTAFTGDTVLTSGNLVVNNTTALQKSVMVRNGGSSTFGTAITAATLGGLAGALDLNLVNTNATPAVVALTLGHSNLSNGSGADPNTLNPVYSGVIGQTTGTATLTKTGSNTQTLTGANTYSGLTTISAGTLLVNNTTGSGLGSGNVTVGGSGTLGGTGTITGTVSAAGTVAPGAGVGTLTTGAVTLTGSLAVEVSGSSADKLTSTGALTLTGATLNVTELSPATASPYVIAEGTGLGGTTFATTNLPAGYSVSYTATQVILTKASANNYATWATANGITGQPPTGDFDNDGLTNLTEYALGLDPKVSSQAVASVTGSTLTYTKGADALANHDVSFTIEESTDLITWNVATTQLASDTTPTIAYDLATGGHSKHFVRLKVVQVP